MGGRLVVVSGTGTGIGKTHVCEALLLASAAFAGRVAGVKPVETGLVEGGLSDALRLARASSFHVKHAGYRFADPVSPHVAARDVGDPIVVDRIVAQLAQLRTEVDLLIVELAGGLFTPLSETTVNAHLACALTPDSLVIVASDRLGVLHDVLSTTTAARTLSVAASAVVLNAPEHPDSSTGHNTIELTRLGVVPWVTMCPRAPCADLAFDPAIRALAARLV